MRRRCAVGALALAGLAAVPAAHAGRQEGGPPRIRHAVDAALRAASAQTRGPVSEATIGDTRVLVIRRTLTVRQLGARAPSALAQVAPGVWQLSQLLLVLDHATLIVRAPEVRELRLVSAPGRISALVAIDANLRLSGGRTRPLVVRSWNRARQMPDRLAEDGRAYVAVLRRGRLDATRVTFAQLGFAGGRFSGVAADDWPATKAWPLAGGPRAQLLGVAGFVAHSRFLENYDGAYASAAGRMHWVGNTFVLNRMHGLVLRDVAAGHVVEGNYAAWNGRDGIACTGLCRGTVIRDNFCAHNGSHGIVVDGSPGRRPAAVSPPGAVIEHNWLTANGSVGIFVDDSSRNVIRGNHISGGQIGIRLSARYRSDLNLISANSIEQPAATGIWIDDGSSNTRVETNRVVGSRVAVLVHGARKTLITRNSVTDVRGHAVEVSDAQASPADGTLIADNRLAGAGASAILIEVAGATEVRALRNHIHWRHPALERFARVITWFRSGSWLLLLLVLLGGRAFVLAARSSAGKARR